MIGDEVNRWVRLSATTAMWVEWENLELKVENVLGYLDAIILFSVIIVHNATKWIERQPPARIRVQPCVTILLYYIGPDHGDLFSGFLLRARVSCDNLQRRKYVLGRSCMYSRMLRMFCM